jgi:prolyl oligopeptidase PreP (S9A serine peptidase family)
VLFWTVKTADFTVLFTPSARISLSSYSKTKSMLVLNTLENVKSRLHFWSYEGTEEETKGGWTYKGAEAGESTCNYAMTNPANSLTITF